MSTVDNLTRAEAQARAHLLSDVHYRVHLDLSGAPAEGETFESETLVRFRCAEPGATTFVDLAAPAVRALELNGSALAADAFDGKRIHLSNLRAENEVRVVADCAYLRTGMGMHRAKDPVDGRTYLYTQFESFHAHHVFACFDQPDLKATFDFVVTAPTGWEVISNSPAEDSPAASGTGIDEGSDGTGRWTFATTPLLSTYVTAIVAGPYHVARDYHRKIALGLFCRRSLAPYLEAEELFALTKQGLDCFEQAFGYPYPFAKYDQLFVPEYRFGAMENAACVTFADHSYLFRSKVTDAARESRAETLLHEMAHMWFGDLVTMRWWDDLWLNESFATFAALFAEVNATRFKNAWATFASGTKGWAYRQDQLPSTHPITVDIPDVEASEQNFDGITYAKGAAVLRQLVAWVGEDAFLRGLQSYFRRHEFGNTELRDFLAALEETSGRDLTAWSTEWLERAGLNTLRPAFETQGQLYTSFDVLQEASPEWPTLRSHRAAVGLYDLSPDGLVRRRQVELDIAGARTAVPALVGERVAALVLLNDGDLAYAKVRLDPRSLATLTDHLGRLRDDLARALCWSATWQAVRDAELPAGQYLPLVLNNIEGESDIGVMQQLLDQVHTAVLVYGDSGRRPERLATLAATSLERLRAAEPAGDRQLAWARAFISAARSTEHLAALQGLLDGSTTFPGLAVDTDLRWQIVRRLATTGAAGEDLIESEVQRDPSDQGKRQAISARASRPTPEAKGEAWAAIVHDRSLSLATMRAYMAGFRHPEQQALLQPYVAKYFQALGPMWQDREFEVALEFGQGLYPRTGDEVTLRLTDEYLASADPAPPLRRLLIEGKDDLQRALRARAADVAAG